MRVIQGIGADGPVEIGTFDRAELPNSLREGMMPAFFQHGEQRFETTILYPPDDSPEVVVVCRDPAQARKLPGFRKSR